MSAKAGASAEISGFTRRVIIYSLAEFVQRGAGFVLVPLYTACLSPAQYGNVGVLLSVGGFLGLFFAMGFPGAVPIVYHRSRTEEQRTRILWSGQLIAIGISLLFGLLFWWGGRWGWERLLSDIPFRPLALLLFLNVGLECIKQVPLAMLRTAERAGEVMRLSVAGTVVFAAAVVFFLLRLGWKEEGIMAGLVVSNLLVFALIAKEMWKLRGPLATRADLAWLFHLALPLIPHSVMIWVNNLSDRMILQQWVSGAALGQYTLAYQLVNLMFAIAVTISSAWNPMLLRLTRGDVDNRSFIARMTVLLAAVYLLLGLGVALGGRLAILFFIDPAYWPAIGLIPWLVGGGAAGVLYLIPSGFVMAAGRTRWMMYFSFLGAVTNLLGNLWLVPRYGISAAAGMTLLAYLVMLVAAGVGMWRLGFVTFDWRRLAPLLGWGAVVFLAGWNLPTGPNWQGIASALTTFTLFGVGLVALRIVPLQEIRASGAVLRSILRSRMTGQ